MKLMKFLSHEININPQVDIYFIKATYIYFFLPVILFYWGWLNANFAVLFSALSVYTVYSNFRNIDQFQIEQTNNYRKIPIISVLFCVALFFIWFFYSGIGHFSFQTSDYLKHNLVLSTLIQKPWPIVEQTNSKSIYELVYYFGYYLLPALVGKIGGYQIANIFQFFWSSVGVIFVFYFIFSFTRWKRPALSVLIFILFGGLDIIGIIAIKYLIPSNFQILGEFWNGILQYSSNTTLLYFVPQHAIPGWILATIFLWVIENKAGYNILIGLWGLSLFWSPFVFIGFAPFLLYTCLSNKADLLNIKSLIYHSIIVLIILPILLFYQKNPGNTTNLNILWQMISHWQLRYLLFIFLEFLSLWILILWLNPFSQYRIIELVCIFTLTIIPFITMGTRNDFCMRVSIPALALTSMFSIKVVTKILRPQLGSRIAIGRALLIIILVLGTVMSIYQISFSVIRTANFFVPYNEIKVLSLPISFGELATEKSILYQYLYYGDPNLDMFWR